VRVEEDCREEGERCVRECCTLLHTSPPQNRTSGTYSKKNYKKTTVFKKTKLVLNRTKQKQNKKKTKTKKTQNLTSKNPRFFKNKLFQKNWKSDLKIINNI
jgi:hypothetical protein